MITFLKNQKLHLIYGVVILFLIALSYRLFVRTPDTITKTKVVTQVVTKVVTKKEYIHDNIVTDRRITTKKPDGTTITETDHTVDKSVSGSSSTEKTASKTKISEKTVTSYRPNYTLTVMYPLPFGDLTSISTLSSTLSAQNMEIMVGKRLLDLPILLDIGTTFRLNTLLLGITLEL